MMTPDQHQLMSLGYPGSNVTHHTRNYNLFEKILHYQNRILLTFSAYFSVASIVCLVV